MGWGYCYKCRKCQKEYSFTAGIGMMMPRVFQNAIAEIKEGAWGEEWRALQSSERFVVPDVEKEVYVCRKCGKWASEENMSLYAANDPAAILQTQYGIKTVEQWGEVPYVTRRQLKQDYHLLKRRRHICNCGNSLHKATNKETKNLPCPYCGTSNTMQGELRWD